MNCAKCPSCGLVSWAAATRCKRCQALLVGDAYEYEPEPEEPLVRDDGLAWASLMLGLGGFLLLGLSSLVGLLAGVMALRRAKHKPLAYGGQRYAMAGIIVSSVSSVLLCGVAFYAFSVWRAERQARMQGITNKAAMQSAK